MSDRPLVLLERPVAYTWKPARPSSTAIARPHPRVAPATRATRLFVFVMTRAEHVSAAVDLTVLALIALWIAVCGLLWVDVKLTP